MYRRNRCLERKSFTAVRVSSSDFERIGLGHLSEQEPYLQTGWKSQEHNGCLADVCV